MKLERTEIVYGGVAGAALGLAYQIGQGYWSGTVNQLNALDILGAAAVGAVAGILAFVVRRMAG